MYKILVHRRRLFAISMVSLVLVLTGCNRGLSVQEPLTLKVMTYNIHHGAGTDGVLDLARIAEVIGNAECDIVGLQEVDKNFGKRSDFLDQAKWLAEKLDMHYVYAPAIDQPSDSGCRQYGDAMLSRYPILESKIHPLPTRAGYEPRGCLEAKVQIKGRTYTFMVTHLDHKNNDIRKQQVAEIMKISPSPLKRTILMGDFNAQPSDEPVACVREKFKASFVLSKSSQHETVKGFGRIDYIFVSPDLSDGVMSYAVIDNEVTAVASDHFPVAAEIKESF